MNKICSICGTTYYKRSNGESLEMWNRRITCGKIECRTTYRKINRIGFHSNQFGYNLRHE